MSTDVYRREKNGSLYFKRGTNSFNVEVTLSTEGVFKTTAKRGKEAMTLLGKEVDSYQWGASQKWCCEENLTPQQQRAIADALEK